MRNIPKHLFPAKVLHQTVKKTACITRRIFTPITEKYITDNSPGSLYNVRT